MKAPLRLRDDPNASHILRSDLDHSATAPPEYDVAAGLLSFQALIGAPVVPPAAPGAAPQAAAASAAPSAVPAVVAKSAWSMVAGSGAVKAALVATAVAGATAVGWPRGTPPASRPSPSVPEAALQVGPDDGPIPWIPAPVPAVPRAPAPAAAPPRTPATKSRANQVDAALRREIAQVGRIKALLERDPARAYALAQVGDPQFSRGMMREEREALAIVALWNAGSKAQAVRDARNFLERYPRSPLRARLETLLGTER